MYVHTQMHTQTHACIPTYIHGVQRGILSACARQQALRAQYVFDCRCPACDLAGRDQVSMYLCMYLCMCLCYIYIYMYIYMYRTPLSGSSVVPGAGVGRRVPRGWCACGRGRRAGAKCAVRRSMMSTLPGGEGPRGREGASWRLRWRRGGRRATRWWRGCKSGCGLVLAGSCMRGTPSEEKSKTC